MKHSCAVLNMFRVLFAAGALMLSFHLQAQSCPIPAVTILPTDCIDNTSGTFLGLGTAVSMSANGSLALVGVAGISYLYAYDVNNSPPWTLVATFNDPVTSDNSFGQSVALSGDGSTALISAPYVHSLIGVVYVYQSTSGVWSTTPTPVAEIDNPDPNPNTTFSDNFGTAMALTSDGRIAIIGAPGTTETVTVINGTPSTQSAPGVGIVYVYTRGSNGWSGAPIPAQIINDPNTVNSCTAFSSPYSSTVFGCDEFGSAVALDSLGDTALVGAPGSSVNVGISSITGDGAVWVLSSTAGTFSATLPATLDPDGGDCASNGGGGIFTLCDGFGLAVALSADGGTALIGAPNAADRCANLTPPFGEEGQAQLYSVTSSGLDNEIDLGDSDASVPNSYPAGFGHAVALSSNGTVALVGAPKDSGPLHLSAEGAAYVFSSTSIGSSCGVPEQLLDPANSLQDYFGTAVALSSDGTVQFVGAPDTNPNSGFSNNPVGEAYIYDTPVALPIANSGTLSTSENNAVSGTLTSSNAGSSPMYAVASPPVKGGTVTINNPTTGTFTYTPAIGFSGSDSFTFDVSNSSVTSTPATITITVIAAQVSLIYVGPGSSSNNAPVNSFIPNLQPPTPQPYVYTATVTNTGSVTADNLSLIVNVPTGITVLSDSSNNGGTCPQTPTNGTVTCTLPSLSTRASWVVTVTVTFNSVSINTPLTDSARLTLSNGSSSAHVVANVVVQATTGSSSGGSSGGGSLGWLELLLLASLLWLIRRTRKPPRTMPPSQSGARAQLHPFSALAVVVTVAIPTLAGCALNLKPSPADGSMGLSPSPANLTVGVTSNTEFVNTGKNGTPTTIPATLDGAAVTLTCSSPSICSLSQGFAVGAHTFAVAALVTWPAFYSAPTNAPVACNVPGNGTTLNQCYSLTTSATFAVGCAQGALTATNTTLIPVPAGKSASYQLEAQGGCPPYTWTVGNPGGLPPGISISPMGLVAGTETTACTQDPWTFDNTIKVTDSLGDTGQASMTFNIC